MSDAAESKSQSIGQLLGGGCLILVLGGMVAAGAAIGLIDGAACVVSAERIAQRKVEEAMETNVQITGSVEREVQPGRVDVTVQRRIIGIVPISTTHLEDVVQAAASGDTKTVRKSSGQTSSSYSSSRLTLITRSGKEWRSPEASYLLGTAPGEVAEQLAEFISRSSPPRFTSWWSSWLSNLIGVPFALLLVVPLLLMGFGVLSGLVRKIGGRVR